MNFNEAREIVRSAIDEVAPVVQRQVDLAIRTFGMTLPNDVLVELQNLNMARTPGKQEPVQKGQAFRSLVILDPLAIYNKAHLVGTTVPEIFARTYAHELGHVAQLNDSRCRTSWDEVEDHKLSLVERRKGLVWDKPEPDPKVFAAAAAAEQQCRQQLHVQEALVEGQAEYIAQEAIGSIAPNNWRFGDLVFGNRIDATYRLGFAAVDRIIKMSGLGKGEVQRLITLGPKELGALPTPQELDGNLELWNQRIHNGGVRSQSALAYANLPPNHTRVPEEASRWYFPR